MITKGDIVSGALQVLATEGLLLKPMADDQRTALQHLDDMAATYQALGVDAGYINPAQYSTSTGSDDSGLDVGAVGPYKVLLAGYIAQQYGKSVNPGQLDWADKMLRAISLKEVGGTKYPETLPVGSGNYDGPNEEVFYRGGLPI